MSLGKALFALTGACMNSPMIQSSYQREATPRRAISRRHHWWPETVSKFWKNAEGGVFRQTPDGSPAHASDPKSFGVVKNDNNIRFANEATVWDSSFENSYQTADDNFGWLIEWLLTFRPTVPPSAPLMELLEPHPLADDRHKIMGECLASLIARSPNFRHRVKATVDHMRQRIGITGEADKNLVRANVAHTQRMLADCFARRGKFVVMRATEGEFIFGDGFFHSVSSSGNEPYAPRCLIPLTPEMAVFYTAPSSYISYPKFFAMNVDRDDVAMINYSVQVYACDEIFYRSQAPALVDEFRRREHLKFEYDKFPMPGDFEASVANGRFPRDKLYVPER